jgi:hypothetical protein
MKFAGKEVSKEGVQRTVALLKHFRAFLASDCQLMSDPLAGFDTRCSLHLTKERARRLLHYIIDVAINRKAGIPDFPHEKCHLDFQNRLRRDQQRLKDIHNRIRVYQFETKEVQRRFSHLLSRYDD